jgi:ribosome biogenesis protein BRX1
MIPHAKKDQALRSSEFINLGNIASDRHCDTIGLFETRHRAVNGECYLWIARTPEGPSVNFFIEDAQCIRWLRLIGNCLKGSRPILQFDPALEDDGVYAVAKNLLFRLFAVPFQDPHSKPFVDRTMTFLRDGEAIVIRHYQIQWGDDGTTTELAEIGPRVRLPEFRACGGLEGPQDLEERGLRVAVRGDKSGAQREGRAAQEGPRNAGKQRRKEG